MPASVGLCFIVTEETPEKHCQSTVTGKWQCKLSHWSALEKANLQQGKRGKMQAEAQAVPSRSPSKAALSFL